MENLARIVQALVAGYPTADVETTQQEPLRVLDVALIYAGSQSPDRAASGSELNRGDLESNPK